VSEHEADRPAPDSPEEDSEPGADFLFPPKQDEDADSDQDDDSGS
jgi:hypothetical protein